MQINKKAYFSVFYVNEYHIEEEERNDFSTIPRPFYNLAFFLRGGGEITFDGKTYPIKQGDVLFIPKGSTYSSIWRAENQTFFHTLHFDFYKNCDPFFMKKTKIQFFAPDDFSELYKIMVRIDQANKSWETQSFAALSEFFRLCNEIFPRLQVEEADELLSVVSPAVEYLENNYMNKVSVRFLAELCYLSPSRFFTLFKKATGVSPIVYKNNLCIQNCTLTLLLDKKKSVEEIAEQYGFESAIYFRRLFKKLTGKTPTEYRKIHSFV